MNYSPAAFHTPGEAQQTGGTEAGCDQAAIMLKWLADDKAGRAAEWHPTEPISYLTACAGFFFSFADGLGAEYAVLTSPILLRGSGFPLARFGASPFAKEEMLRSDKGGWASRRIMENVHTALLG